jgi:phenylalanyl-tRNA synthetase beta chain
VKVSRRWLEAFLRRPLEARELAEKLALLGAPADAVVPLHRELSGIVVALVEEVRPHPNADRLQLCLVNDGTSQRHHVVCGATNVAAGEKYPFARVGTALPGGLVIEKRKIRGEASEGMLCSSQELGLGTDHDGIMTLSTDAAPGTPFLEVLTLDDDRLELDTPPVRPDLLGHKGVARELAAAYQTMFRLPEIPTDLPTYRHTDVPHPARSGSPARCGGVLVSIEPGSACARFTAAVIRGVTVGPSPAWLRQRLEAIGQRSINNVVDATNYVMFELGQPLHAYDLAKLAGPSVAARKARPGERLATLDGVDRELSADITVIADAAGPVGVAGVMGGRGSEVSAATTDLFLECAWFQPGPTRAARRALGISTEASLRFERGTDLWSVPDALRRCILIVLATSGGRLDGEPVDCWPEPTSPPRIFLRTARVAQVLGVELPVHVLEQCLVAIGATLVAKPAEQRLAVEVPGWRPDLREEIDLIEEIARIYGYGAFPDDLRPFRAGNQTDAPIHIASDEIRRGLVAEGLYETLLLPLGPADGAAAVPVLNPLSADHGFLRARLTPGLVRQVEVNWANQVRDVRLFEIGTVFSPGDPGGRPVETTRAAVVLTGAREPAHWTDGGRTPMCDSWDLRGLFERAVSLAIPGATVQVEGSGWVAKNSAGREVGRAGPLGADAPPWAAPLFGLEVDVDPGVRPAPRFRPLPTTPAATRDLALLVPGAVGIDAVIMTVREAAGGLLETVGILDEYRGRELPTGRRSVAVRVVLRGRERTLRDADVEAVVQRILSKLGQALDVTLRTS